MKNLEEVFEHKEKVNCHVKEGQGNKGPAGIVSDKRIWNEICENWYVKRR